MADNQQSNLPDDSRATYDAAQLALGDFKSKIQNLENELTGLRAQLLSNETEILQLKSDNTQLQTKIKEKDNFISNMSYQTATAVDDTTPDSVPLSSIDISDIVV